MLRMVFRAPKASLFEMRCRRAFPRLNKPLFVEESSAVREIKHVELQLRAVRLRQRQTRAIALHYTPDVSRYGPKKVAKLQV